MSGLDLFAGIAAAIGVIQLCVNSIDKYHRANKELEEAEQARLAARFQTSALRVVFKGLASNLQKYNKDIARQLGEDDKAAMDEILDEIDRVADTCKGTVQKLEQETRKSSRNKKELDICRNELNTTMTLIHGLQTSWLNYIAMETLRKVSIGDPDNDKVSGHGTSKRRELKSEPKSSISRVPTNMSGPTLVRSHTTLTTSSSTSAGSSLKSTGKASSTSTVSSKGLVFTDDEALKKAVERADLDRVKRILRATEDEDQLRSYTASALLLACRFRRKSIVETLLTSGASVDITDERGRGVMHAAISTSESLDEAMDVKVTEILRLLVQHKASVAKADKTTRRLQPLHYCAMTGNYHAAKFILGKDAGCVNTPDADGQTALYHACLYSPYDLLVKLLLVQGANFGSKTRPKMDTTSHAVARKLLKKEEEKGRKLTIKT